ALNGIPRRSTGSCEAPLSFCATRCQVPVRSSWADAGVTVSTHECTTTTINAAKPGFSSFIFASPSRRTRRRIPLLPVGFLLEDRRRHSHVGQILAIVELCG